MTRCTTSAAQLLSVDTDRITRKRVFTTDLQRHAHVNTDRGVRGA
jgi:hypothetical protein